MGCENVLECSKRRTVSGFAVGSREWLSPGMNIRVCLRQKEVILKFCSGRVQMVVRGMQKRVRCSKRRSFGSACTIISCSGLVRMDVRDKTGG